MKQFDLEKYNRLVAEGKTPKVVTRDGQSVRIVCTDVDNERYPIVGLIQKKDRELINSFTEKGQFVYDGVNQNEYDLFFADLEPTYRSYKDKEECFRDVQQHGFLIRSKMEKVYHLIVTITSSHIWLGGAYEGIPMDRLLNEFEYISGQPCGVKVE